MILRIQSVTQKKGSRGSSVSIVSDYGLDDRGSIPDRGRGFSSSLCVQTGSGAHPASCTVGTGDPFPEGKARPGRDADHSPHLVPKLRMSRAIPPLTPSVSTACSGITLLYLTVKKTLHHYKDQFVNAV
jgi:hypothetical protein